MKRYQFRFEHVARVRKIQEDQARAELLAARHRLLVAEAELAARSDDYRARLSTETPGSAAVFRSQRHQDDLLATAVTAARCAEANARLAVSQRIDIWTEAARKVAAMERLDERDRERHAADAAREEQAELDDLVAPRHAIEDREGR